MADTTALLEFANKLKAKNAAWVAEVIDALGEVSIVIPRETIVDVCIELKDEHQFDLLADLCGADRGPEEDPRFVVNYHLFSTKHFGRLRLKVRVGEDDAKIHTVSHIWRTADWHERETYDLFGIVFENHPDLRRILLPSDFDGYALRKDYPLRGYEPYSMN
ncbi:MAG TPA: NADH-quinone oxidoreductase subunit C [Pyrinomonadaceae bacterium]|jgi:NADH-quinone oxidoreductase subunit C